jgi:type IV secretion system protein VirB8
MIPADKEAKDPTSDYYKEAMNWQEERYDSAIKNSRRGWVVAIFAGSFCLLLAIALAGLTPLKTVEPYTILVDKLTGETRVVRPLKEGTLTQSEAVTKYFVNRYVQKRVGYDFQDIEETYEQVRMMSDTKSFDVYAKAFDPKKEDSPYQVYGEEVTVQAKVKSISFLGEAKDRASVRIDIIETSKGKTKRTPWIITMSFQFTLEPRSEDERFENPLGFQATKWRIDAEIVIGVTQ